MGFLGYVAAHQASAAQCPLWVISVILRALTGVRPLGWTVSCGGFDSLPGVVILELCRAQIAERGV